MDLVCSVHFHISDLPCSLYVGSLHFNLTESDIKQVFEVFGELEFVDLHRDPMTGRSKGYAFVQWVPPSLNEDFLPDERSRYKRAEDARMALQQMEGFELAGRTVSWSSFRLIARHMRLTLLASRQHCPRERNSQIHATRLT